MAKKQYQLIEVYVTGNPSSYIFHYGDNEYCDSYRWDTDMNQFILLKNECVVSIFNLDKVIGFKII